jgi:hypothetical protein
MTDHLVSSYLAAAEQRIEAPINAKAVIFDISMSIALAFAFGFFLLVL